ncbi:MAG: hypothetical protein MJ252_15030 [archaeon]|nr:hypothetical protein [archaeon]
MASNKDIWDDFSSDDEAAAEKIKTEKLLLKKFKPKVKNTMDEKELLELIREKKYNESEIDTEIKNKLKYIEAKGDEYGWQEVVKGKKLKKIELEAEEPNEEIEEEEYNTYDDRYSKKY